MTSDAGSLTYPAEVIVEGQQMQKISVRFHKAAMPPSRILSPVSRNDSSASHDSGVNVHADVSRFVASKSSDDDLDLPFPQEVSRASPAKSESVSDSDNHLTMTTAADETDEDSQMNSFDAVRTAKEYISSGLTYLEKQYDLVNSRLKQELRETRKRLRLSQQQLETALAQRNEYESENAKLKRRLDKSEAEVERLQQKEVNDLHRRLSVEEDLIRLQNSTHESRSSAPQLRQLENDLRGAQTELERVRQENRELENQLRTLQLSEADRRTPKQTKLPIQGVGSMYRPPVRGDPDEAVYETGRVTPLPMRLQRIRHDRAVLLTSTMPAALQQRPSIQGGDEVIAVRGARPLTLPMIGQLAQ